MRPMASTWVASMQNIAAPDSASVLMCVKCQSLAAPFTAEYWHIGATMMRLGSARPRSLIGENRALMGMSGLGGSNSRLYLARRRAFLNRLTVRFQDAANANQVVFIVIARSQRVGAKRRPMINSATKQSSVTIQRYGLLRGACHRARISIDKGEGKSFHQRELQQQRALDHREIVIGDHGQHGVALLRDVGVDPLHVVDLVA